MKLQRIFSSVLGLSMLLSPVFVGATTTVQGAPTIVSFTATPSAITSGQSSVLSWQVDNASSTSIDHGIGVISSTSVIVTPSVTTTYTLSATNPNGTDTSSQTITVNGVDGGNNLQSRIQNLLTQIANLRSQLMQLLSQQSGNGGDTPSTSTTTGTSSTCFFFSRDLFQGTSGEDVRQLQQHLAQDPLVFPEGQVTGFFGPKTAEAVKRYQQKYGIASTTTGFFGSKSRGFFHEHCKEIRGDKNEHRNNRDNQNQGGEQATSTPFNGGQNTGDHRNGGEGRGNGGNPNDN